MKKSNLVLVINSQNHESETEILEIIKTFSKLCKIRSRNLTAASLQMIIEVKTNNEHELLVGILNINGVNSASLLSHDGEIVA